MPATPGRTSQDERFAAQIPWIIFKNNTGQTIPPFSCVEMDVDSSKSGWNYPDPNDTSNSVDFPYMYAVQPNDPINPHHIYLTDFISVSAGGFGRCARPALFPMLGTIGSDQGGNNDTVMRLCGPQNKSWKLTRDAPGFQIVGLPQSGLAMVRLSKGPYSGQLPTASNTAGSVKVTPYIQPFFNQSTGTASSVTVACWNPYASIDTTQTGANLRCTFDFVGFQWELLAADPCPPGT